MALRTACRRCPARRSGSRSVSGVLEASTSCCLVVGVPARRRCRSSTRSRAAARRCWRSRRDRPARRAARPARARRASPACWPGSCSSRGRGRRFAAPAREQRGAIGFALLTGASIAAYSAVDRVGVRDDRAVALRRDPGRRRDDLPGRRGHRRASPRLARAGTGAGARPRTRRERVGWAGARA